MIIPTKEQLSKDYSDVSLHLKSIKAKYQFSDKALYRLVRLYKLPLRGRRYCGQNTKYSCNEAFFARIDSEAKAYTLGFFAADGCIHKNHMIFNIHHRDKDVLTKIRAAMDSNHPIRLIPAKQYISKAGRTVNQARQCSLTVSRKSIAQDLRALGFSERKSLVMDFPEIPEALRPHFIRGYFDGDGGVSENPVNCLRVSITGTKNFLTDVKNHLALQGITASKVAKNGSVWIIKIGKRKNIHRLWRYLYNNTSISLDRKKRVFDDYFARYRFLDTTEADKTQPCSVEKKTPSRQ